jgi:hypothetical protein
MEWCGASPALKRASRGILVHGGVAAIPIRQARGLVANLACFLFGGGHRRFTRTPADGNASHWIRKDPSYSKRRFHPPGLRWTCLTGGGGTADISNLLRPVEVLVTLVGCRV